MQQYKGVQLKKEAYHKLIRQKQLDKYFGQRREELCLNLSEYHPLHDRIWVLLEDYPRSVHQLLDVLNDQVKIVAPFLIKKISYLCEKMVKLQMVDWSYTTHIINKLLVSTSDKKTIDTMVHQSILPVLEGAFILAQTQKDHPMFKQLLSISLEYCFRLGLYVKKLNTIQQNALINMLILFFRHGIDQNGQLMLMTTVYSILNARFDEDQNQNIKPSEYVELEHFKLSLITKLFYQRQFNGERWELKMLLRRSVQLVLKQGHNEDQLIINLRVLIMMTLYLNNSNFYYPLLQYQVIYLVQCIYLVESSQIVIIMATRLLNNLLVNDSLLTTTILEQFNISKLVTLHSQYPHKEEIQIQIAEFFMNLMHFSNDDDELVRKMVDLGVGDLVVQCFEMEKNTLRQDTLSWAVSSLTIMFTNAPRTIRKLVFEQDRTFQTAMDKYPYIASSLEYFLASVTHNDEPMGQL